MIGRFCLLIFALAATMATAASAQQSVWSSKTPAVTVLSAPMAFVARGSQLLLLTTAAVVNVSVASSPAAFLSSTIQIPVPIDASTASLIASADGVSAFALANKSSKIWSLQNRNGNTATAVGASGSDELSDVTTAAMPGAASSKYAFVLSTTQDKIMTVDTANAVVSWVKASDRLHATLGENSSLLFVPGAAGSTPRLFVVGLANIYALDVDPATGSLSASATFTPMKVDKQLRHSRPILFARNGSASRVVYAGGNDYITAIDLGTLKRAWTHFIEPGKSYAVNPSGGYSAADGVVFAVSRNSGCVLALDVWASGNEPRSVWPNGELCNASFLAVRGVSSAPVFVRGKLYVALLGGGVGVFDARTGAALSSIATGSEEDTVVVTMGTAPPPPSSASSSPAFLFYATQSAVFAHAVAAAVDDATTTTNTTTVAPTPAPPAITAQTPAPTAAPTTATPAPPIPAPPTPAPSTPAPPTPTPETPVPSTPTPETPTPEDPTTATPRPPPPPRQTTSAETAPPPPVPKVTKPTTVATIATTKPPGTPAPNYDTDNGLGVGSIFKYAFILFVLVAAALAYQFREQLPGLAAQAWEKIQAALDDQHHHGGGDGDGAAPSGIRTSASPDKGGGTSFVDDEDNEMNQVHGGANVAVLAAGEDFDDEHDKVPLVGGSSAAASAAASAPPSRAASQTAAAAASVAAANSAAGSPSAQPPGGKKPAAKGFRRKNSNEHLDRLPGAAAAASNAAAAAVAPSTGSGAPRLGVVRGPVAQVAGAVRRPGFSSTVNASAVLDTDPIDIVAKPSATAKPAAVKATPAPAPAPPPAAPAAVPAGEKGKKPDSGWAWDDETDEW